MVVVKVDDGASDIELNWGIQFVRYAADSLNLPYVLCLCHGYRSGARDGESDPLEGALSRLLNDRNGDNLLKGVVVAAGNDNYAPDYPVRFGNNKLHARGIGTSEFRLDINTTPDVAGDDRCYLELWYPTSSQYQVSVVSPEGFVFGPAEPNGESVVRTSPEGVVFIENDRVDTLRWGAVKIRMVDPPEKPRTDEDCGLLAQGRWRVRIEDLNDLGGIWDAYVTFVWPETLEKAVVEDDHDNYYKVLTGGNVRQALTVGSVNSQAARLMSSSTRLVYASRFPVGGISHFSSRGPTRAERPELEVMKPEIYAEGGLVEVALSRALNKTLRQSYEREGLPVTDLYGVGYGTSEAAPRVAGAIALMVARDGDNSLTHETIKDILLKTADDRRFSGESFRVLDIEKAVELSRQY